MRNFQSQYHSYCPINSDSEEVQEVCWLGDTNVALADLKTEDPVVAETYQAWIKQLVQEYSIDGLRIDGI